MPSIHSSSCGEKVEMGKNFEAFEEKFRGRDHFSAVLVQAKVLALSLTTKVVDIRTGPSILLYSLLHSQ